MTESTSKTELKGGRLMIAVIVLLAGAVVVLIAGVIFMQEEIRSLRGTVEELKPLQDDVTEGYNNTRVSKPLAEREHTRGEMTKGRHMKLSRSKRSLNNGQCEPINIPRCQNMGYNLTQFPNLLNHRTQDQALMVAKNFEALADRRCFPLFGLFLCSVLAPPCHGFQMPIPPCKELCLKATRSCRHLLNKFNLTLPSAMRCGRLPKEGTSKCLNESSLQRPSQCRLAPSIPYRCMNHFPPPRRTQFPNYFGHRNTKETSAGLSQFDRVFEISVRDDDCLFLLLHFLCRLYVPPCRKSTLPLPPCRELCAQARSRCSRIIDHIGFQWPSDHKCQHFPRQGEAPCYSGPSTGGVIKLSGKCQVMSIPLCKNVPYNMTVFPNFFWHKTQLEASLEVHRWWPLVERKCSPDLALFLCSLYAPLCTTLDTPPLPCRELCLRVQQGCSPALDYLYNGYNWPDSFNCEKFPRGGSEQVCIDRPQPGKSRPPVTVSHLRPGTGRCEALSIPVCYGLHYNTTLVPNYFNHRTQDEAASEINPVFLYELYSSPGSWNDCSPELPLFVCSLYAPPCTVPRKPCRQLCRRVRNRCLPHLQRYGYHWPESMDCDKFPFGRNESECIGASARRARPSVRPTTSIPPED